jgi:hypothetical protein
MENMHLAIGLNYGGQRGIVLSTYIDTGMLTRGKKK